MYFPVLARYSSARNLCQAEGGDLIKIDSQEKYDIFKDYHGMFKLYERFCVTVKRYKPLLM